MCQAQDVALAVIKSEPKKLLPNTFAGRYPPATPERLAAWGKLVRLHDAIWMSCLGTDISNKHESQGGFWKFMFARLNCWSASDEDLAAASVQWQVETFGRLFFMKWHQYPKPKSSQ